MSDIRTIDFVEVDGEYRVAIADANGEYEAAVVETHDHVITQMMKTAFSGGGDTSEWTERYDAPRVYDEQRYVAIGKAVEQYLDMEVDDE